MELNKRDKQLIWHPFSKEKIADLPIVIKKAQGSYLYDEKGNKYLDLISSWWVNLHGHGNPYIANAIYEQAKVLEHVIFADFTHEPAVKICELIKEKLLDPLGRFFFSDNGSTAVEVAIKMAYQYWINKGEKQRKLFLSFSGGYHGDTIGAMSVGAGSGFHDLFKKLLFDTLSIPYPETWDDDQDILEKEKNALAVVEQYLEECKDQIAAVIIEPLVQGASGMRMSRPDFIKQMIAKLREHGILVIFDEVMTGFGRTGTIFAFEQVGIMPDFLCVSKGITGGFLPLSLTVTTDNIYDAFVNTDSRYVFAHGHSYTANPIACAAAVASWELLNKSETKENLKVINQEHIKGISYLKENCKDNIEKTRITGTIAAFDICANSQISDIQVLRQKFLAKGLLLRPLGSTFYLIPPYSITKAELSETYQKIYEVLEPV